MYILYESYITFNYIKRFFHKIINGKRNYVNTQPTIIKLCTKNKIYFFIYKKSLNRRLSLQHTSIIYHGK